MYLKVSKFQNEFIKSSFLQKYELKTVRISPLYLVWHSTTGQKSLQYLVHILGETMTSLIHSEIYWPLDTSANKSMRNKRGKEETNKPTLIALGSDDLTLDQSETSIQILPEPALVT